MQDQLANSWHELTTEHKYLTAAFHGVHHHLQARGSVDHDAQQSMASKLQPAESVMSTSLNASCILDSMNGPDRPGPAPEQTAWGRVHLRLAHLTVQADAVSI